MPVYTCLQEALKDKLKNSGISGIVWETSNTSGSPYYGLLEAPPPVTPLVQYDIETSQVQHTFDARTGATQYASYVEEMDVTVRVIGLEAVVPRLGSPYVNTSVIYWLDRIADLPTYLSSSGDEYSCQEFTRKGWKLYQDVTTRDSSGQFVWCAEAHYKAILVVPYPPIIS